MDEFFHMAGTLATLADPSRLAICVALLDNRARTAGELARVSGVTPQTASSHLRKLLDAGLVVVEAQGRHRFYRLASFQIGELLESLGEVANLRQRLPAFPNRTPPALRRARSCYDHLAGELGVVLRERLEAQDLLRRDGTVYHLSPAGHDWHQAMALTTAPEGPRQQRAFARCCLDWSERTPHVGGILGAALLQRLLTTDVLRRGTGRQLLLMRPEREMWRLLGL